MKGGKILVRWTVYLINKMKQKTKKKNKNFFKLIKNIT